MSLSSSRLELIAILKAAYSGELAAAYAYRGHWKSLSEPGQRTRIRQIEDEEWLHRKKVGVMLGDLGARPDKLLELRMLIVGRGIGALCHLTGWFLPMYFAGRLEGRNIVEYRDAALRAAAAGFANLEQELLTMAAVEADHESFFAAMVVDHPLLSVMRRVFGWGPLISSTDVISNELAQGSGDISCTEPLIGEGD